MSIKFKYKVNLNDPVVLLDIFKFSGNLWHWWRQYSYSEYQAWRQQKISQQYVYYLTAEKPSSVYIFFSEFISFQLTSRCNLATVLNYKSDIFTSVFLISTKILKFFSFSVFYFSAKQMFLIQVFVVKRYCTVSLYSSFYTATNVHSTIKQVLQIIHTSLAIGNSFMRSLVRGTNGPVFMLRETGTNEL